MHKVRMVLTQISSIEPLGGIMFSLSNRTGLTAATAPTGRERGNALHDQFDRLIDADRDRALIAPRRLESRKLAVEQARRHEVVLTCGKTPCDQLPRPLQVN